MDEALRYKLSVGLQRLEKAAENLIVVAERMGMEELDVARLKKRLKDIREELLKPGRDPREIIKVFEFDSRVKNINDLQEGMILPGIVTNITSYQRMSASMNTISTISHGSAVFDQAVGYGG